MEGDINSVTVKRHTVDPEVQRRHGLMTKQISQ